MGFRGHRGTRAPFKSVVLQFFGTWRSPVAHLSRATRAVVVLTGVGASRDERGSPKATGAPWGSGATVVPEPRSNR